MTFSSSARTTTTTRSTSPHQMYAMWPSKQTYTRLRTSTPRLLPFTTFYLRKSLYLLALLTTAACIYYLSATQYGGSSSSLKPPPPTGLLVNSKAEVAAAAAAASEDPTQFSLISPPSLPNETSGLPLPDYLIKTSQCIIPRIPLFTPETRLIYRKYPTADYHCNKSSIEDAIVRINYTYVSIPKNLKGCIAREVIRAPYSEENTYGRQWDNLAEVTNFPDSDAILVSCNGGNVMKLLPLVPVKKPFKWSAIPIPKTVLPKPINVLMIGIDAVSRLNFLRHFPRTSAFLDQHNFTSLLVHHKVGDNTLPNMFGMFLGQQKSTWWSKLPSSKRLDGLPIIFKYYSNGGYLTTYIEDYPYCGLFTYHGVKGFNDQITEYYLRPVNLWLRKKGLYDHTWCYGNKLEMEHYYEYVHDQLTAFRARSQPHLTWIHQSTVSHEEVNQCQYTDGPVFRLLSQLFTSSLNENTLIFFYSDHAIRIGKILETESGFHETRLPFLYVYVPESIRLQDETGSWMDSAKLREKLQYNSGQLTSHMDVHATLRHILHGAPQTTDEPYGRSLFTSISPDRTCAEAGVPSEYCLCKAFSPLGNHTTALLIATKLVGQFNAQLEPYADRCAILELGTIVNAKIAYEESPPSPTFAKKVRAIVTLVFTVHPSGAKFDATVRTVLTQDDIDLNDTVPIGKIARNDRYAEQSYCVAGSPVEFYCYCRELLATTRKTTEGGVGLGGAEGRSLL